MPLFQRCLIPRTLSSRILSCSTTALKRKLYQNGDDFALVYPFIPYQFDLLGSVLTSIRTHGASGKHLAEGERSMLALFKESAVRLMNKEPGALVPFNMFYDALEQFLDHSHKGVITKALDNSSLNSAMRKECFYRKRAENSVYDQVRQGDQGKPQ